MIESNIINWIDLGDSMQSLDIYGKKKMIKSFKISDCITLEWSTFVPIKD